MKGNTQLSRWEMFLVFITDDNNSAAPLSTLHRNKHKENFLKGKFWTVSERIKWSNHAPIQLSVQLRLLGVRRAQLDP